MFPKPIIALSKPFRPVGRSLANFFPTVEEDLQYANIPMNAEKYFGCVIVMVLHIFLLLFLVIFVTTLLTQKKVEEKMLTPVANIFFRAFFVGLIVSLVLLLIYSRLPKLKANSRAKLLDIELLFALRDMLIQLRSGMPVFKSIINIGEGEYGEISKEFRKMGLDLTAGVSIEDSLKNMAKRNKSIFIRKFVFQALLTIKSGSGLDKAIGSIIRELQEKQSLDIREYAQKLNLCAIVYMLGFIVVPSIGIVIASIFATFLGCTCSASLIYLVISILVAAQFGLVQMIHSLRPKI
jgi:flagellar protein FlaJ